MQKQDIHAVGRRKTAIAQVSLKPGSGKIAVNKKELQEYFPTKSLQHMLLQTLELVNARENVDIAINVNGGGLRGQAEACQLGIARGLQAIKPEDRPVLKKAGHLRRDSRMVERKKYGLHKARRGTQFSKR